MSTDTKTLNEFLDDASEDIAHDWFHGIRCDALRTLEIEAQDHGPFVFALLFRRCQDRITGVSAGDFFHAVRKMALLTSSFES